MMEFYFMPTLGPPLSPSVHLGLSVTITTCYSVFFLAAYIQLWIMRCRGYKRVTYQSTLLALCMIYSALRIVLFTHYFHEHTSTTLLPKWIWWFLVCFPIVLQYSSFALICSFYIQVLSNIRSFQFFTYYKKYIQITLLLSVILFLSINVVAGIINYKSGLVNFSLVLARVVITSILFLAVAILLSFSLYCIAQSPSTNLLLEARGITKLKAILISGITIILFTARAFYNMLALVSQKLPKFGFNWIDVTEQADFRNLWDGHVFLMYGIVLILWEIIPTLCVLYLFQIRLKCCHPRRVSSPILPVRTTVNGSQAVVEKSYFFSNIRRYDSVESSSAFTGATSSSRVCSYKSRSSAFPAYYNNEMRPPFSYTTRNSLIDSDSQAGGGSLPPDRPSQIRPPASIRDTLHLILPSPREENVLPN